ncbi:GIY-YIG nuclease family protein [Shouchella clausii]|uniref:GIY-YIG nuclease family protein n=1 Tax=Shouchella clausii TaxID=79880 RepID=UPI000BA6C889|nr:GIY-YIG nuclease family protein [Shouchella clausii]PAD91676.1 hypothetical protein CHH52_13730 [Shouchella clausii]
MANIDCIDKITKSVFQDAIKEEAKRLFGSALEIEVDPTDPNCEHDVRSNLLSKKPIKGIYFLLTEDQKLLYVGKSENISNRVVAHIKGTDINNSGKYYWAIRRVRVLPVSDDVSVKDHNQLEKDFIKALMPAFNGATSSNTYKIFGYDSLYFEMKSGYNLKGSRGQNRIFVENLIKRWPVLN